jgi:glycine/D-amino acid oxidase-like deaminating enzyme
MGHGGLFCRRRPGNRRGFGGTFSPDDGSASPLLAINAFARKALENGARFSFNERIKTLLVEDGRVVGLQTDKGQYRAQVVFCITPDPPILGTDTRETSVFLPQVAARMAALIPRLKTLRVRRVWRGCCPMSPDGSPIVGWSHEIEGLFHVTGMCGQGFMLGPGMGELAAGMISGTATDQDQAAMDIFSPARPFSEVREALK